MELTLGAALGRSGHRNVRMFNLAMVGHTSRDSWLKYSNVGDAQFDLVLVYDGINDARANNAPPGVFRDDYGHFAWYAGLAALAPHHRRATFALRYTIAYVSIRLWRKVASGRYVPAHEPRPDWTPYGREVRSAGPFAANMNAILDLAAQRGDRVMLMTLATYVPPDYSLEAFKQKRLAYGLHISPIELWGEPAHVIAAVAAHNRVIRGLAAQRPGVLFVDQAELMANAPQYFNDVCHFTVAGSREFAAHVLRALPGWAPSH